MTPEQLELWGYNYPALVLVWLLVSAIVAAVILAAVFALAEMSRHIKNLLKE